MCQYIHMIPIDINVIVVIQGRIVSIFLPPDFPIAFNVMTSHMRFHGFRIVISGFILYRQAISTYQAYCHIVFYYPHVLIIPSTIVCFHYHCYMFLSEYIHIKSISTCVASGLVMAPVIVLNPIYDPHIRYYIGRQQWPLSYQVICILDQLSQYSSLPPICEPRVRIELTTFRLQGGCTTTVLSRRGSSRT